MYKRLNFYCLSMTKNWICFPTREVPEHDQKGLILQRIFASKELAEIEPKEARKRGRRKGNLYGSKPAESYEDYMRDRSKFLKKNKTSYGSLKAYTEEDDSFMDNNSFGKSSFL